jgi:(2Fe-2S) ferredoxin/SAM-dependent methyltransferase
MSQPFRAHLLVCTQEKPDRTPCCAALGGRRLLEALQAEIGRAGVASDVLITGCGCLGLCERGPNVVVYPEGRWYTRVRPEDAPGLVREHGLARGDAVQRDDPDPDTIRREVNDHRALYQRMLASRAAAGAMPDELETLVRAFQPSRAVLTGIELDVFTGVSRGGEAGATAAEVARHAAADPRGIAALLDALAALGLLVKRAGRYRNAPAADTYLRAGAAHDARPALLHTVHLWERWGTLTESVRRGTAAIQPDLAARGPDWTEAFIAAMHRNATLRAPIVVAALDLAGVRRLLDVGGGSGAYASAFARSSPDLVATVLDLPHVTPLTRRYVAASDVAERVRVVDGDLGRDAFGSGFDLVFLSAVCHMLDGDGVVQLLRRARAALAPGGRVVIHDFVLDDDKAGPRSGALFALNMLVGTPGGGAYSAAEYGAWLATAGFEAGRFVPLPGPTDLMVAVRPPPEPAARGA